ncbi:MAG: hypothetical protein HY231_22990 [Acidobacteria bacterium]|nr:hypothetical protein [Acidobacteriota bacterium]
MEANTNYLTSSTGDTFEQDFIGECEVVVKREGHSRARHTFTVGKRIIARLKWIGMRRAVYEVDGQIFDINVKALGKSIALIAPDGSESFLIERSKANPHKAGMRVEMAEGDNFRLLRKIDSRLREEQSIVINKKFYQSHLLVFHFNTRVRSQTTVRVMVEPAMRWEARFMHRILALVVCRIILERRNSGTHRTRMKEKKPPQFSSSVGVRERKKVY